MSRLGKIPVNILPGVTVISADGVVKVTGPKGELSLNIPRAITVEVKDNQVIVNSLSDEKKVRSNHGSTRAHLNNMINGVVTPWQKDMEIRGTGYKFSVNGNKLVVTAGFIHPVNIDIPQDIQIVVTEDSKLKITGIDKVKVGQIASNIRKIRKPEPYKGKGIRYVNEFIKLKAGKTAKA